MNRHLLLLALPLLCSAAFADERQDLRQQRAAAEARFKAANEACQQRFAVNACRDEARAQRNAELRPLQAREQVLMAQERQSRSAAQSQRVAERQREFESEEGRRRTEALQPQKAEPAIPRGALPSRSLPVDPEAHARDVRRQADEAARAAAEAREQAGKRQRLVLQHQQDFQKRQGEKEAAAAASRTKPPGKPLPVPSAAEIAAAASAAKR